MDFCRGFYEVLCKVIFKISVVCYIETSADIFMKPSVNTPVIFAETIRFLRRLLCRFHFMSCGTLAETCMETSVKTFVETFFPVKITLHQKVN